MRRADASNPSLVHNLPVVVFALDLALPVLVHEVDDHTLGSVVGIFDVSKRCLISVL